MGVLKAGRSIDTSFAINIIAAPTELEQMHATAAEIERVFVVKGKGSGGGGGG